MELDTPTTFAVCAIVAGFVLLSMIASLALNEWR